MIMPKSSANHSKSNNSNSQQEISTTSITNNDEANNKKLQYDEFMKELETNKSYVRDVNLCKRVILYRMRGELGTGNFSLVKLAIHELTNEKVAIKVFMKDKLEPQAYEMALAEIANQAELEHPHVVRLYEAIQTPTRLYMATEFAGGGELFFKIADEGRFSDDKAKIVFRQILDAVAFLHSKLIIHRDLKAENVMFTSTAQCWIKIGDFGFSTRVKSHDEMLTTFCGSPPYAAPELYRDDKYDGFLADIWSLGVLLYFIVTGMLPFRSSNLAELRKLITFGRYRLPEALPAPCRNLISKLLSQTPSQRPSLYDMSNGEWLKDVGLPSAAVSAHLTDDALRLERHKEAVKMLNEIGIEKDRLDRDLDKSVWSPINGCYRIIAHRLEKNQSGEPEAHDFPFHLYNLGYEPQRYRVSSGDVLTVSHAAQVANYQQQQNGRQGDYQITSSYDDSASEQVKTSTSCLPRHSSSNSSHNNQRRRHRSDKQSSTVCSIL